MFDIKWTGDYPTLCFGEWIIKYNGKELELPENITKSHMNTFGEYESWHFDDNWSEVFESYVDGLNEFEWLTSNMSWVRPLFTKYSIPFNEKSLKEFYKKIQEQDFRTGSCGGCI